MRRFSKRTSITAAALVVAATKIDFIVASTEMSP
jgi:hypothetical protein